MTGSRGVTLIELLVGMACFSIIVALVTGIFVTSLAAKKQAKELSVLQDEARYIMDYMTREIRVAKIISGDSSNLHLSNDIDYQFDSANILREGQKLNTVNVNGNFTVDMAGQPKVTINMTLTKNNNSLNIQTTISSRVYE